jgi:HD-GYP domain-containing protein (c-di-GMP phosphodiesterase class II)
LQGILEKFLFFYLQRASIGVYLNMTIRMDSLIKAIATALDMVEGELLGVSTNHGKRIAVLCAKMGKILGQSPDEITALAINALLHDNALTEYILSERINGSNDPTMKKHCEYGQRNVNTLRFKTDVKGFILYHHERADGNGPFGLHEGEGPLGAELIAIADSIDAACHLQGMNEGKLPAIRRFIAEETGKRYSKTAAEAMLEILDWPAALSLKDDVIKETAEKAFHPWLVDVDTETILGLAGFMTKIIDYKSIFTQRHTTQIANRAWLMAEYYKYDSAERTKLYLAAALHDIGKLNVPTAILEKPDRLTDTEFSIIKGHVNLTWELLKDIEGLEIISAWASNHHEKLNGSGYPFGKKGDDLDFNSRLIACIDIYQAISEERPYHPKQNHETTMQILYKMANEGKIDENIVKDIDIALKSYDGKDLPQPEHRV